MEQIPFEEIIARAYDSTGDMLYRVALSYMHSRHDAEDAVQDAFTRYLARGHDFSDPAEERAWLTRVTVNRCIDLLRRKNVRKLIHLDDIAELSSADGSFEESSQQELYDILQRIPERNRAAVILHYLEGFSVEETAKMLGVSLSAAKMRLARGREALREYYERSGDNV